MVFKQGKKFTSQMVKDILKQGDQSLPQIKHALKCSQGTAEKRIKELLDSGKVQRKNFGTEKKPFYIYSLTGTKGEEEPA